MKTRINRFPAILKDDALGTANIDSALTLPPLGFRRTVVGLSGTRSDNTPPATGIMESLSGAAGSVHRPHILELDGVRGIAALMVFGSHAFRIPLLWSGVDLFFVLSGFLITGNLLDLRRGSFWRGYIGTFYARRARRLVPPYLLFLGVTSLLFGIGWIRHWYLYFLLMNIWRFDTSSAYAHGILWSLAVEEQFYLIWPVVVYALDDEALAWFSGGMIIVAPLLRWFATAFFVDHWSVYAAMPFRMDLFAAGALIALGNRHFPLVIAEFGYWAFNLGTAIAVILCELSMHPWFQPSADTVAVNVWLYELTLLSCSSLLIWALSARSTKALRVKPLVYLGTISYSVYLIHFAALTVARRLPYRHGTSVIAFTLTLGYAAASWQWIERPLLRAKSLFSVTLPDGKRATS